MGGLVWRASTQHSEVFITGRIGRVGYISNGNGKQEGDDAVAISSITIWIV